MVKCFEMIFSNICINMTLSLKAYITLETSEVPFATEMDKIGLIPRQNTNLLKYST